MLIIEASWFSIDLFCLIRMLWYVRLEDLE